MTRRRQLNRVLILVAATLSTALPCLFATALAADVPDGPEQTPEQTESRERVDTITVEAQRKRELQRQISHFVSSFDVTYLNASLERWNSPVCPLVAGLSGERGEFILARLSQIARDSHVPLAGEHCRPNLYVVVTGAADLLVDRWTKRDRGMFNSCNGYGYVREFLRSRRPVRVFYNATLISSDGAHQAPGALDLAGSRLEFSRSPCISAGRAGSRLIHGAIQSLSAVVVVVDETRVGHLNMGQLADYVAMVGLAQIRPDANTGAAPTILGLFQDSDSLPQGLSLWDRLFLESLYTTEQSSVLHVQAIEARMVEKIAGH